MKRLGFLLAAACVLVNGFRPASAGSFVDVDNEIVNGNTIPYAIVHPPGFSGAGGHLFVDICVLDSGFNDGRMIGALQAAIETWNSLAPTTGNCQGCVLWEEMLPAGAVDLESVLLHELGHCAMGLGHVNLGEESFTKSVGATSIVDGNGIRGDLEDQHLPPVNVHDMAWFRKSDNDPVVVDALVIDINTFSRSVAADLPGGHNYAASANRAVAEAMGFNGTQSVMYSRAAPQLIYNGLAADDVNMVKLGMAGSDFMAASPDDYSVLLRYRAVCDGMEEIQVEFFPVSPAVGICYSSIAPSFPQSPLQFHWTATPIDGATAMLVSVDVGTDWDFGERVFSSGFEVGDSSEWSMQVQ